MRINRQILLKIAEDAVDQRVRETRSLLAVYICGSVNREEDPLLGESGDVDLVFVHEYDPGLAREFVRVTNEITLDIRHHTRKDYQTPRELRSHPWLGPTIYDFKIMHDPRHFLDFTQASLRDQYFRPDNVLRRAQALAGQARRGWVSLLGAGGGSAEAAHAFLEAAGDAANAIASLEGDPLPERRLLTRFHQRTVQMGQPALYTGLLELLGAGEIEADDLPRWAAAWEAGYRSAAAAPSAADHPAWGLHPLRLSYHQAGLKAQLASERPADALWPLLISWTRCAVLLPEEYPARAAWQTAASQIGVIGDGLPQKLEALDAYLDQIEEMLVAWGRVRGVEAVA